MNEPSAALLPNVLMAHYLPFAFPLRSHKFSTLWFLETIASAHVHVALYPKSNPE